MGSRPSKPVNDQQPPAATVLPQNSVVAVSTPASSGAHSDSRKSMPRHTLVGSSFRSIFSDAPSFPLQSSTQASNQTPRLTPGNVPKVPPKSSPTTSHPLGRHVAQQRPPIVVADIPGIPRVESTTFDSEASSPRTSPKRPRVEKEVSRGSNSRSASPRIVTFSCPASPTRDNNAFFQKLEEDSSKLPEPGRASPTL